MHEILYRGLVFMLMVVGFLILALAKAQAHNIRNHDQFDCLSVLNYLVTKSQIKTALNLLAMATVAALCPLGVMEVIAEGFSYEGQSLGGLVAVGVGVKSDWLIGQALKYLTHLKTSK